MEGMRLRGVLYPVLLFVFTAAAQNVKITWIGQACFLVETEGGPVVITDPPAANMGYPLPQTAADVVTITHNHTDHNNSAGVRGSFTLVDGRPTTERTEMNAAGLPFVLIPGFHDATNGSARGRNTIIRWTQAGLRFAHFGDYGQAALTDAQLADLRDLDVLLAPAGGFFTVDAGQTAALAAQLRPRVTILMHFRTALGGPGQLAGVPAVGEPFNQIRYKPASVVLSRSRLPAEPEAWLMEVTSDLGVVNAASFAEGVPVAQGALASVFGDFAGSATLAAGDVPLPRKLGETEVLVGSEAVPLIYASPRQINFQVPGQATAGQRAIEVRVGGQRVGRGSITTLRRAPGLFAVLNQDGRVNSASNPARRGQVIQIYATGSGAVTPQPADGAAAASDPLSKTPEDPAVFVGGRLAAIQFTGLAPGFVGVWQINAVIPADGPTGRDVSLVVLQDVLSNVLTVTIE